MSYREILENGELEKSENKCNNSGLVKIKSMFDCPRILSGMSHEMRTHMNSIVAFSFLMNSGNFSEEEKKEFSNHILSSCDQLMFLFDNFFDSAIIDTGNSKAEPATCSLDSLVNELKTELRAVHNRQGNDELALIFESQPNCSDDIYVDANRVKRVLRNLFVNALNNTKSGYIKIGCRRANGIITFYVLDTGNSFLKNAELLNSEDLNEAMRKYDDITAIINLTVSKKIVNIMGGKIWIVSNEVSGSGLYFSIPSKKADSSSILINKHNNKRIII
ncbi:MAG: HAMP domain-containing histidine kinase [Bacteroidales bacterium]|nr:HAMP domain-containing histidine kinase [Bacteroidales bacterium]